jgi:hypothetical protein
MKTVGGFVYAHNAVEYDYTLAQTIECLAATCDRVVVCDCESTDGTFDVMWWAANRHPHVRILSHPWQPNKGGWGSWLADLANFCRGQLHTDFWFHLQADEVIHEADYGKVIQMRRKPLKRVFVRNNYWTDHRHVTPPNRVCSSSIVRFAPIDAPLFGDGESASKDGGIFHADVPIHHYGFIRKPAGFAKKARLMETAFTGGNYNPIIDTVEREGVRKLRDEWDDPLLPPVGEHPSAMIPWLEERGFSLQQTAD